MKIFVTGASGWIGAPTVAELLTAGHEVRGLARSDTAATTVQSLGAMPVRGDLDDLSLLRREADSADAVFHLGKEHDWRNLAASNATERAAVQEMCEALAGSGRAFLLASGVAALPDDETTRSPFDGADSARGGSENLALDFAQRGVRSVSLGYPPMVHGIKDGRARGGFLRMLIEGALRIGASAYIGDGANSWSACNVADAARANVLALNKALAGTRLHISAENVPTRRLAEAIGYAHRLPAESVSSERAVELLGPFIGGYYGIDRSATAALTRAQLSWEPTAPGILDNIANGPWTP